MKKDTAADIVDTRQNTHQGGVALIAVILVVALLATIAAAVTLNARTGAVVARNTVEGARARALADAGVNLAVLQMLNPDPALRPPTDGTPVAHTFAGGVVTVSVQDEGGKIDLNRGKDEHLKGLFMVLGVESAEADALVDAVRDYRDSDDLKRLNGAEDDDYRAAGMAFGAKDARFTSVDELRRVMGMTEELFELVAGSLTVHGKRRVNTAVAPPLARAAVLGEGMLDPAAPLAAAEGASLMPSVPGAGTIGATGVPGAGALPSVPDIPGAVPARRGARVGGRTAYTIRAQAVTPSGAVFIRQAVVRLSRRGETPFTVLEWKQGLRLDDAPPAMN